MKRFLCIIGLALAGLIFFHRGCRSNPLAAISDADIPDLPQFSPKNGLLLPEQSQQSLALKFVDVEEQNHTTTLGMQLCVYEADDKTALASGIVTPELEQHLHTGQLTEIRRNNGAVHPAKVMSVNDQFREAAGSFEALVEIDNSLAGIAIGEFLQASVTMESSGNVITIPRAALLNCSEGEFVYAVNGKYLVRTAVKIGASNSEMVEIIDGLYDGDQVVLQPVMSLWMIELAAVKGGQACCIIPPKGK